VSHLTKTETTLVIWLHIVIIVARSVRLLSAHMRDVPATRQLHALSMMVWSMPCQTCRRRCFSLQYLFR